MGPQNYSVSAGQESSNGSRVAAVLQRAPLLKVTVSAPMKCNLNSLLLLALLTTALGLGSCSGFQPPNRCSGVTCTLPNATVSLTLAARPLTPPPGTSILAFSLTITSVSLTPSSGSDVNVPLPGTVYTADLTRLQSDSAFLGEAIRAIPPGTYTKLTLAVNGSRVIYCTQPVPGTPGCASGSIATVSGGATVLSLSSAPFPLTLADNQIAGLRVQFDMSKALTINAATQAVSSVDVTKAGVVNAVSLPPAASSLGSNEVEFVEDVTGVASSVTGSSSTLTLKTAERGSITVTANPSTFYSPNCTSPPINLTSDFNCVKANQLASMDVALDKDGTFTLLEYDPLDTVASDWIEGVVTATPSSSTQFDVVTNDMFLASTGSMIANNVRLGDRITVNLKPGAMFGVDSKGLTLPADATTFQSANDTSVLRPGQTVAVRVASLTAAGGSTPGAVSVDLVELRFTRVAATVFSSAPPNNFFIQNLPPFFGTNTQEKVQLTQAAASQTAPTNFDGVTDPTGLSNGQVVSIRAMYFGPGSAIPFSAAKVRKH